MEKLIVIENEKKEILEMLIKVEQEIIRFNKRKSEALNYLEKQERKDEEREEEKEEEEKQREKEKRRKNEKEEEKEIGIEYTENGEFELISKDEDEGGDIKSYNFLINGMNVDLSKKDLQIIELRMSKRGIVNGVVQTGVNNRALSFATGKCFICNVSTGAEIIRSKYVSEFDSNPNLFDIEKSMFILKFKNLTNGDEEGKYLICSACTEGFASSSWVVDEYKSDNNTRKETDKWKIATSQTKVTKDGHANPRIVFGNDGKPSKILTFEEFRQLKSTKERKEFTKKIEKILHDNEIYLF